MGPVRQIEVGRGCQDVRGRDVRVLVGRLWGRSGRLELLLSLVARIEVGERLIVEA